MKFTYASGSRPLDGYTIKRGVGRGGFGEVYYATSDGGKEVALKLIRRNLEVELRGVRHCLNLKNQNLVALYDIKTDEHDDRWVVMEYVSGESLEDAIDRNPNGMPREEVIRWMRGICSGVAYLHDQGIVHRDLKPGNIFSDEGTVKIGDYGLSKFISCSRRSGQTESVGTVHYMAPEIANGRYGKEIDTYALGIILYEMLTGHVPFEGESVGEVLMKHLTAEPKLDLLEPPFRTIVERALAKDPATRFTSVSELAAMLPGGTAAKEIPFCTFAEPEPKQAKAAPEQPAQFASLATPVADATSNTKQEPISAAVRQGLRNLGDNWNNADMPPIVRASLIVLLVIVAVMGITIWIPVAFVAFILYGIYWVVWALIVQPQISPTPTQRRQQQRSDALAVTQVKHAPRPQPVAEMKPREPAPAARQPDAPRKHRRRHRKSVKLELARMVSQKSTKERLTELTGSMLLSAIVSCVASMVVLLLGSGSIAAEAYTWFAVIGTLGSWAVIIPAKFFEGKVEDQSPKRFTQLVLGLAVGVAAWGLADALATELPLSRDLNAGRDSLVIEILDLNHGSFHSGRNVPLPLFVGYFGFLLMGLRWWIQADWTRYTRVSIWALAIAVGFALALQMVWWFPQPAGAMLAGVMALSIQLSSPWLSNTQRRELVHQIHTA